MLRRYLFLPTLGLLIFALYLWSQDLKQREVARALASDVRLSWVSGAGPATTSASQPIELRSSGPRESSETRSADIADPASRLVIEPL